MFSFFPPYGFLLETLDCFGRRSLEVEALWLEVGSFEVIDEENEGKRDELEFSVEAEEDELKLSVETGEYIF